MQVCWEDGLVRFGTTNNWESSGSSDNELDMNIYRTFAIWIVLGKLAPDEFISNGLDILYIYIYTGFSSTHQVAKPLSA